MYIIGFKWWQFQCREAIWGGQNEKVFHLIVSSPFTHKIHRRCPYVLLLNFSIIILQYPISQVVQQTEEKKRQLCQLASLSYTKVPFYFSHFPIFTFSFTLSIFFFFFLKCPLFTFTVSPIPCGFQSIPFPFQPYFLSLFLIYFSCSDLSQLIRNL